jgi:hypothetical protein
MQTSLEENGKCVRALYRKIFTLFRYFMKGIGEKLG